LLAAAEALEAQAKILRALAAYQVEIGARTDRLLGLREIADLYHVGREGILAAVRRNELAACRGARACIMVRESELDRWIAARPVVTARAAGHGNSTDQSLDDWDRQAERERERFAGNR